MRKERPECTYANKHHCDSCIPVSLSATPALVWQRKATRSSVSLLFDNARLKLLLGRWPVFLLMYFTCRPLSECGVEQGKIRLDIRVYSRRTAGCNVVCFPPDV